MTTRTLAASTLLSTFILAGVAVAEEATTNEIMSGKKTENARTADLGCIRSAVEKRDTAIFEAFETFSNAMLTAFSNRRDALGAAWGIGERKERKSAIAAAWKAFQTRKKNAERAFKEARRGAWQAFNSDRKKCRGADEARDMNEGE